MNPPVLTYSPHPSRPHQQLPSLTCDSHVHVFGPAERFAYASSRNFTPVDAPKERLFDLHRHLGVERCVIVQSAVHDHGPTSFACYDLTAAEVMGSPAWLAVRATDWSSRCRPHFTNTRRTFFQSLHTLSGASP